MELAGFDPDPGQDNWKRVRSSDRTAARDNRRSRRGRLLVSGLMVGLLTAILVALATWQGARIHRLIADLQQMAAEYTWPRSTPERAAPAPAAQKTAQSAKRRGKAAVTVETTETTPRVDPPVKSSQFVEVVDSTNRHYLVRLHTAPVLPLPGEQPLQSPTAAAGEPNPPASRRTGRSSQPPGGSVNLHAQAPGSAGIVVLSGLVGKDGTISNLEVVSGPPELAAAAFSAAQRWHYVPEYIDGRPNERRVRVTVDFTVLLTKTE
jgi:outer membrane biosynthesis protein TonB